MHPPLQGLWSPSAPPKVSTRRLIRPIEVSTKAARLEGCYRSTVGPLCPVHDFLPTRRTATPRACLGQSPAGRCARYRGAKASHRACAACRSGRPVRSLQECRTSAAAGGQPWWRARGWKLGGHVCICVFRGGELRAAHAACSGLHASGVFAASHLPIRVYLRVEVFPAGRRGGVRYRGTFRGLLQEAWSACRSGRPAYRSGWWVETGRACVSGKRESMYLWVLLRGIRTPVAAGLQVGGKREGMREWKASAMRLAARSPSGASRQLGASRGALRQPKLHAALLQGDLPAAHQPAICRGAVSVETASEAAPAFRLLQEYGSPVAGPTGGPGRLRRAALLRRLRCLELSYCDSLSDAPVCELKCLSHFTELSLAGCASRWRSRR
ncbi:hypothetical protein COCOBI_02-5160 [Coccomyxa sp. Obi]|nr:hypothetical protein COCOBI_02-5160 [Coccomyxa sp. Obi]